MKVEAIQEQLLSGINIVSRAVASRAQLPVLSHILFEATVEGVVLSATDLEIGIKVKVPAKVEKKGVVAVPAKMFSEFLASLPPGKVEIELAGETLVLKAPGYKGKFQTISPDEFPEILPITKEAEIGSIPAKTLKEAIEGVVFASAKDSLRPILTGVLWEVSKKKIRLVATDGFRLAIEDIKVETKADQLNLLVPSRVVMEVIRLGEQEEIMIGYTSKTNQVSFMIGEIQVVSQLLAGNFPEYGKILPKEFVSEVVANKDELLQGVRATHIFARDNSNMVKWQVTKKKLTLSASSPERGECSVEVPITLSGDDTEIIFNAKYVLDYLTIAQGETIEVGMGDKLAPGMFRDPKRESGRYIVMPINA